MLIFIYVVLAIVVGVAAKSRGRSGLGWFFLALIISPLLSGLLVLVLRRIDRDDIASEKRNRLLAKSKDLLPSPPERGGAFESDGVFKGFPYRFVGNGIIEAQMVSGTTRFRSMEHFQAAVEGRDANHSLEENVAMPSPRSAILRVFRRVGSTDQLRKYKIAVNGREIGTIARNSAADFEVPSGSMVVTARIDWGRSQPLFVEARPGERVEIEVSNTRGRLLAIWSMTFGSGSYLTLKRV